MKCHQITPAKADNYDDVYSDDEDLKENRTKLSQMMKTILVILKKRCQMNRMMMDIIDMMDTMNGVIVIEAIIIVTEDMKGKPLQ